MTIDQLSRINIRLQLFSDRYSGLHTGKMTTEDAVQICREIVDIADEEKKKQAMWLIENGILKIVPNEVEKEKIKL